MRADNFAKNFFCFVDVVAVGNAESQIDSTSLLCRYILDHRSPNEVIRHNQPLIVERHYGCIDQAHRLNLAMHATARVQLSHLLRRMIISSVRNLVFIFGVLIALSQLGISLGPLLAGLGIAGFIIGFAMQDSLSNFASGMLILVYRPFDVGDVVDAGGVHLRPNVITRISNSAADRSVFLDISIRTAANLRASVAILPTNEAIKNKMSAADARVSLIAESLQRIIGLLIQLDQNVAHYRQQLLTATGEITTDVLDVSVVASLLKQWSSSLGQQYSNARISNSAADRSVFLDIWDRCWRG